MLVSVNGTTLHVTEHGAGPPMLVLHGGLGLDHATLRPWLDGLGEQARLIFLDLRGCGRSEPLADVADGGAPVTHATWAADCDALRAHLGFERWTVFGHSYGSFLALEYALRYGDRLEGLALCSSAPALAPGDVVMAHAQDRGTPEALAALAEGLAGPIATDAAWEAVWRGVAPLYLHRPTPERITAITDGGRERIRYRAAAFNASFLGCAPAYDVRDRLGEIGVPALVVSGRHDWICPPEHGALPLAAGLPHADLVILEESGHFPFVEEPEAFRAAVAGWLASAQTQSVRSAGPVESEARA